MADATQAEALLANHSTEAVTGDKDHDADSLVEGLAAQGIDAVRFLRVLTGGAQTGGLTFL